MDIVSYYLIMFLLFGNTDNTVGYYNFCKVVIFYFLFSEMKIKCILN